jgi:riboflavin biosynthesis pyrimidine reductase
LGPSISRRCGTARTGSVLIEGGGAVITSALAQPLVDRQWTIAPF